MQAQQDSRRRFIKLALAGLAVPAALAGLPQVANAQDLPHLDEADPTAAALGYKHDATKADAKKFPSRKPEQTCAACNFAQGKAGDAWRPCTLFPGKAINAKGWCSAWAKKA